MHKEIAHDLGPESDKVAQGTSSCCISIPTIVLIPMISLLNTSDTYRYRTERCEPRHGYRGCRIEHDELCARIQRCDRGWAGDCRVKVDPFEALDRDDE